MRDTATDFGGFIRKHDGIYFIPTISYIHPNKLWPHSKLDFTFLKWTVGFIW